MIVFTLRRFSSVSGVRSSTFVFKRSSDVQAIPVPVVMVHWVDDEPLIRVESIGEDVEPMRNWLAAVLVALAPRAMEFWKPAVEVESPIKMDVPETVLLTVSLAPALTPMNMEWAELVAPLPANLPIKLE